MWNETAVSRLLNIEYPIIQGPFGGGASSVGLVASVSNAGGLGSFGLQTVEPEEIGSIVEDVRKATNQPFSVNLWVPVVENVPAEDTALARVIQGTLASYFADLGLDIPPFPDRFIPDSCGQMDAMLEARPPVVSFVYGVPPEWVLEGCRSRGIKVLGTATTVEEAKTLELSGVDCIIASSSEAGGHRGSFIKAPEDSLSGAISLIPLIVDAVDLPVVAAGGIADARGVVAALALGAQGVQLGTAFLACEESNASGPHRDALFSSRAGNTKLSRAITGRLARNIQSDFIDEIHRHGVEIPAYPVEAWFIKQLQTAALAKKRHEFLSFSAGQSASIIHHRKAGELMDSLIRETPRLLERMFLGRASTGSS